MRVSVASPPVFATMSSQKTAKKLNYSEEEVDVLVVEVQKHRKVLFGSSTDGITGHKSPKFGRK